MLANDARTLLTGVAIAAASGLLLGAGLKPDLDVRHEARAPQILIPHAGMRTPVMASERGVAAYGEQLPTYVLGTDSLPKPEPQVVAAVEEPDPAEDPVVVYSAPEPYVAPVRWVEPPRPRPTYPSIDGNVAYGPPADDPHATVPAA